MLSGGVRYCLTSFSAAEFPPPLEPPLPLPLSPEPHAAALDSATMARTVLIVALRLRIVRLLRQGVPARDRESRPVRPARCRSGGPASSAGVHAEANSDPGHSERGFL